MPSKVTFSDGSTIVYSYAADGTKLRTVHTISGTTMQKDYCANVVYENGIQKMLLTEEGYVDLTTSTPTYYYYLKDHQGNNRVVINSSGTISGTNHYYPFGGVFANTSVQPYKYNSKELDTKKGLNWYDYGARHYDATLGRWFVVDPLAEKDYLNSPYSYCGNNPIIRVDKNGKIWDIIWDIGNVVYDIGSAITNHIRGNHEQAQTHWQDAGVDALAMAIPGLPAGVSKLKYADDVAAFTKSTKKADAVFDTEKSTNTVETFSKKSKSEVKSINQLKEDIRKGKAPKRIVRIDPGTNKPGEQVHIHFKGKGNNALNKDGTWRHGGVELTNEEKKIFKRNRMENTLTIQNWVEEAKEHINSNNLYVDSWHIDDLVECSKKEWISKSIKTYDIINSIIKERKHENTVCLLVIYLNRKRKSNTLVSKLEYDEISKQDTPPELYLISSNNVIYKEWLSSLMKVCVDGYENYITLYGEFWCSGFDRYLWFVPSGLKVDSTFKCN